MTNERKCIKSFEHFFQRGDRKLLSLQVMTAQEAGKNPETGALLRMIWTTGNGGSVELFLDRFEVDAMRTYFTEALVSIDSIQQEGR